jgi:hypothetical protein
MGKLLVLVLVMVMGNLLIVDLNRSYYNVKIEKLIHPFSSSTFKLKSFWFSRIVGIWKEYGNVDIVSIYMQTVTGLSHKNILNGIVPVISLIVIILGILFLFYNKYKG